MLRQGVLYNPVFQIRVVKLQVGLDPLRPILLVVEVSEVALLVRIGDCKLTIGVLEPGEVPLVVFPPQRL
jgi:hypothetical protein